MRDRKSKWKQRRPTRGATEKETSESITIECSETDYHRTKTICSSSATIGDDESNDANDKRLKDLSMVEKQGKKKTSKIATMNSEYWNSLGLAPTVIEEKKTETVERKEKNKIVVDCILQKPAVVHLPHHSCLGTDPNGQKKIADTPLDRNGYAINEEDTSVFETLWEKRTSANSNNEELEYDFFNGDSDQVVGLNSVRVVSLQNRKREEEKELRLREADAIGGLLRLNLKDDNVSSKGAVKV